NSALSELQAGTHDEVLDGARDKDLARLSGLHHARGDVQGDSARAAVADLALPRVKPGPDSEAKLQELIADLERAPDRARGAVEDGRDAAFPSLDFSAGVALQRLAHDRVVAVD